MGWGEWFGDWTGEDYVNAAAMAYGAYNASQNDDDKGGKFEYAPMSPEASAALNWGVNTINTGAGRHLFAGLMPSALSHYGGGTRTVEKDGRIMYQPDQGPVFKGVDLTKLFDDWANMKGGTLNQQPESTRSNGDPTKDPLTGSYEPRYGSAPGSNEWRNQGRGVAHGARNQSFGDANFGWEGGMPMPTMGDAPVGGYNGVSPSELGDALQGLLQSGGQWFVDHKGVIYDTVKGTAVGYIKTGGNPIGAIMGGVKGYYNSDMRGWTSLPATGQKPPTGSGVKP